MRPTANALALLNLIVLATALLAGCSSNETIGHLRAISRAADPVQLDLLLKHGAYRVDPSSTSFYLSDQPLDQLLGDTVPDCAILHAQLLWIPKPGATPVDPTATNLTLRLALFVDGELGVYGGAGFGWPEGELGTTTAQLKLVGSTLTLLHASDGFRDLISPVLLLGTLQAQYDPAEAVRWQVAASQQVTNRLEKTLWLRRPSQDDSVRVAQQVCQDTKSTLGPPTRPH
jgi:hypothetical protein